MSRLFTRRRLLSGAALAAPAFLAGCDRLGNAPRFRDLVLDTGEWLSYRTHRLIGSQSLAREYPPEAMSPDFRTNGNTQPQDGGYRRHQQEGFANWALEVRGLVARPAAFSLAQLKSRPTRSQITRHDCVEGWSAIGKWTGTPLGPLLDEVGLQDEARYIVFRCADRFGLNRYYESIDLVDAYHPQTILAWGMNDAALPVGHGAPIRLRVERQLGYKHAKFIMAIEAVASLEGIGQGKGGYWEDVGYYDWYAGI